MIYLLLSAVSAFFGLCAGLGPVTLLRPLLDAVSPLSPASVAMMCTVAALGAALIAAFFALGKPLALHPDELMLLAIGAVLGGVLGDIAANRFYAVLLPQTVQLLQNALLFTLIALPAVYFGALSHTLMPLSITRLCALPVAFLVGLLGSFLAFGAEPLTLMLYFVLFDADNDESATAALTIALFAMAGKLITLLIHQRMMLPDASALLWLLPGALIGALASMAPGVLNNRERAGSALLRLSLFTSLLNMAAAAMG